MKPVERQQIGFIYKYVNRLLQRSEDGQDNDTTPTQEGEGEGGTYQDCLINQTGERSWAVWTRGEVLQRLQAVA